MTSECWIATASGGFIDILNPHEKDIVFDDIVQGLCNVCRWGGQAPVFYSVAEHSIHVALHVRADGAPPDVQWQGLMHDAQEAYPPGDVVAPVRGLLEAKGLCDIQENLRKVIHRRFWVHPFPSAMVSEVDLAEREYETRLFAQTRMVGYLSNTPIDMVRHLFYSVALRIIADMPGDVTPLIKLVTVKVPPTVDWEGRWHLPVACTCKKVGEPGWEQSMADSLREVFRRHGVDPASPAFAQLVGAMESLERDPLTGGPVQ